MLVNGFLIMFVASETVLSTMLSPAPKAFKTSSRGFVIKFLEPIN